MFVCPTHVDKYVVTSNTRVSKSTEDRIMHPPPHVAGVAFPLKIRDAIADSGATQIFIMDGTPVINKRPTTNPLTVSLADGQQVTSTHMCDVHINELPVVLTNFRLHPYSASLC
jgi:hypothetical protein